MAIDINLDIANPTSGVVPVNDNGTLVDSVIAESNGNVGIGTVLATEKLDVIGGIKSTNNNGYIFLRDDSSTIDFSRSGTNYIRAVGSGGEFAFTVNNSGYSNHVLTLGASATTINFFGLDYDFRVKGNADDALFFTDASTNNVGIGTDSPISKLVVSDSANDLQMRVGSLTAGISPYIRLQGKNTANTTTYYADIKLDAENGKLIFNDPGTSGGNIGLRPMVIDSSGNVGIGTTNPSTELHVVGAITVNDGNNSTKVGTEAGLLYSGGNQSAFGFRAGRDNTGIEQSAFGVSAGQSNTGDNQSAFGVSAGRNNTGDNQSAFGVSAGLDNTGGYQSAFGYFAGRDNSTNNQSVFGYLSGYLNTGDNQSAFGWQAGRNNEGVNQSAFGYFAGYLNEGVNQSAFGSGAGQGNTGTNQTVFGLNSGNLNTGTQQSAFGVSAGQSNTGDNQSAFGRNAGRSNTGDNNSNFGFEAGYFLSDGTTVNKNSSSSVFLGASTKALGATQANQIVIGYDATGIGANSVVLGNDSIATTALKGNVGIGTTNPFRELDIEGSINLRDSSFSNIRGIYSQAGSMLTFDASSFNLTFGGGNIVANSITGIMDFKANGFSSFMTHDSNATTTTFSYNGSERMRIVGNNGNVGIGTTSPSEKLDVGGIVIAEGYKSADGSTGITQNVNTGGGNTLVIKNGIITQVI